MIATKTNFNRNDYAVATMRQPLKFRSMKASIINNYNNIQLNITYHHTSNQQATLKNSTEIKNAS
jgi:hypothetical protein